MPHQYTATKEKRQNGDFTAGYLSHSGRPSRDTEAIIALLAAPIRPEVQHVYVKTDDRRQTPDAENRMMHSTPIGNLPKFVSDIRTPFLFAPGYAGAGEDEPLFLLASRQIATGIHSAFRSQINSIRKNLSTKSITVH
jgi:hypothetical protein